MYVLLYHPSQSLYKLYKPQRDGNIQSLNLAVNSKSAVDKNI